MQRRTQGKDSLLLPPVTFSTLDPCRPPSCLPSSSLSFNTMYPSGFFCPISSPPAVLEEHFTAASAESVTVTSLACCFPHTLTPSFSRFLPVFPPILWLSSLSSHHILSLIFSTSFSSLPHLCDLLSFYLKMFHISLSVLRTSC